MNIKSYFGKYKNIIILLLLSIVLIFCNLYSIKQCSSYKDLNNNNVVALTDSINYYKTKTNELYVSKTLLMGNLKTLQLANDSLYNVIKDMKLKEPTTIIHFNNTVDNKPKDTTWNVKDSIGTIITYPRLYKSFAFVDKYRELTGNVFLHDSILGLNIDNDKVFLDYVLAIENNKVYIKSNNPYVRYNQIEGLTLPETRKNRKSTFVFGPSINLGYDFNSKKITPTFGISITYGIDILNLINK